MTFVRFVFLVLFVSTVAFVEVDAEGYGVDCSFPIHSFELNCGDLLGDRNAVYEEYMQGCRDKWGDKGARRCDQNEADRIEMSRRQPQSMVVSCIFGARDDLVTKCPAKRSALHFQNFTSTGFKKIKAPKPLWDLINNYWQKNKDKKVKEEWGMGNVYTNNWAADTYMVSVENAKLRGGGMAFKNRIWEAARPTIEAWTGMKLQPSSLYGIRVYTEGAILSPHVDRLPLVSSCIINVDQDVDEPWILEVYDRHDRAVNITMEPGDMVLYESGSLLHGVSYSHQMRFCIDSRRPLTVDFISISQRPFPLKGNFYANIVS